MDYYSSSNCFNIIMWAVSTYNGLVKLRNKAKKRHGTIDVQLTEELI